MHNIKMFEDKKFLYVSKFFVETFDNLFAVSSHGKKRTKTKLLTFTPVDGRNLCHTGFFSRKRSLEM